MRGSSLFLVTLLLSFVVVAPALAADISPQVRAQEKVNSFIVQSGASETLNVTVTTTQGVPFPGLVIVFSAPGSGASGEFPLSTENPKRAIRVTTDSSGIASAEFVVNSVPGVFLVSARLEGSTSAATFAFTNTTDAPATPLTPTAVKTAVEGWVRDQNEVIGLTSRVHGAVYIPGGSVISSALSENPAALTDPMITESDSWLLWVDDFLFADFPHAVRRVLIPADETGPNVMARADVRSTRWWPVVQIAGSQTLHPLSVPLAPPNEAPEDVTELAALLEEPYVRTAPADACAIIVHGPDMPSAEKDILNYRKYIKDHDLVANDKIFHNLTRGENGKLRFDPISKDSFDALVKAAADAGCKKVYLMVAAHGVEPENGDGIIVKSDRIAGKNSTLSWDEYARILRQLGQIEVCVLQVSCFSGSLVEWLQGIGLNGSVITASNATEPAYHDENGHSFAQAFLAAKEGDGQVTDLEALDDVKENDTDPFTFPNGVEVDRIQTPQPQGGSISPNGARRMAAPFVYIDGPGSGAMASVKRPSTIPSDRPITVTVTIVNTALAAPTAQQVVLPAHVPSMPLGFIGRDCGVTTYTLTAQDGNQTYQGTGTIQVGHFRLSPKAVTVGVGQEVEVEIELFDSTMLPFDRRVDTSTSFVVTPADNTIAEPDDASVDVPNRAEKVSFKVKGKKIGKTTFDVFLLRNRARKTLEVTVVGADERQSMNFCEPFDRSVQYAVASVSNPFMHPISMPSSFNGEIGLNGVFHTDGSPKEFVPMQGELACILGGMMSAPIRGDVQASGTSGSTSIAGFTNVPATLTGSIYPMGSSSSLTGDSGRSQGAGDSGARIELTYSLGDGVFPGGPISWQITGTIPGTCGYALDPSEATISQAGGPLSALIQTQEGCGWTAQSQAAWIQVTGAASGSGPDSLGLQIAPNPNAGSRIGTVKVSGATLTVTQEGTSSGRPTILAAVNGASFSGNLASAGWFTIFGTNLSATSRMWAGDDFINSALPTSLDGVAVTVNGRAAYIHYISPTQINALAPDDVFLGDVDVVVQAPGGVSDPFGLPKSFTDPALFKFDPEARRYAAAVHADGTFVGKPGLFGGVTTRPVVPGDIILLFGTGFGPTEPATNTGFLVQAPAPTATGVVVRIGGVDAQVLYSGLVLAGLYQFNIVIPDLEEGDHEVEIFIDSVPIQREVFLTVEP